MNFKTMLNKNRVDNIFENKDFSYNPGVEVKKNFIEKIMSLARENRVFIKTRLNVLSFDQLRQLVKRLKKFLQRVVHGLKDFVDGDEFDEVFELKRQQHIDTLGKLQVVIDDLKKGRKDEKVVFVDANKIKVDDFDYSVDKKVKQFGPEYSCATAEKYLLLRHARSLGKDNVTKIKFRPEKYYPEGVTVVFKGAVSCFDAAGYIAGRHGSMNRKVENGVDYIEFDDLVVTKVKSPMECLKLDLQKASIVTEDSFPDRIQFLMQGTKKVSFVGDKVHKDEGKFMNPYGDVPEGMFFDTNSGFMLSEGIKLPSVVTYL